MRHGPGCAAGKRTLRLGQMKKSLQVPEPEGSRVGPLTVDRAQSGHRGAGCQLFPQGSEKEKTQGIGR